jgi:hypothetical protein
LSDAARLVVVGPGRVGRSLAAGLAAAGEEVELLGRGAGPPDLPAGTPGVTGAAGVPEAPGSDSGRPRTVVFAVPDDALASAVRAWADAWGGGASPDGDGVDGTGAASGADAAPGAEPAPGASDPLPVALHTSGVHGPDVLDPLREAGLAVASWHPLTSLAAPSGEAFRGVAFGVDGDDPAVERARGLAGRLGGRILRLEPGAHARYHAAAVFASNHVAACLAVAADELAAATAGRGGLDELAPLARAALENALERGFPEGLTGPVERGDVGTVRRHLETLPPDRRRLYRQLARELLAVVQDRLPAGRSRELRTMLDPADS